MITQSNYIPWKGYFDMINMVDVFVIYDEVQYTKNDWRNRNLIKTKQGNQWLTIPCKQTNLNQSIDETIVSMHNWSKKHWQTIRTVYGKAPFFKLYNAQFEELYLNINTIYLSEINYQLIKLINAILGIETELVYSKELNAQGDKTERLVDICKKLNADTYLSGPAAKCYLNESVFNKAEVNVEWMDYTNYPDYPQLNQPFEHGVSILDLLFNTGEEATKYMKSFQYE